MTTGMPIVIKGVMKPIPTLRAIKSVDINTKGRIQCEYSRSDSCAVPAAAVVAEAVELGESNVSVDQFPSDTLKGLSV